MVEWCHRTLQSVITKVIQTQEDWPLLLNSVLFSMCCHTHSSTGYSPICLLFSKDAILPFELANKKQTSNDSENDTEFNDRDVDDGNEEQIDRHSEVKILKEVDEVVQMVETIEKEWKEIFASASTRIIKTQKHQAKGYNRRHGIGTSFDIGMKVLKRNTSKSLSKLTPDTLDLIPL